MNKSHIKRKESFWDKIGDRIVFLFVIISVLPVLTLFNSAFRTIIEGFFMQGIEVGFNSWSIFLNVLIETGITVHLKNSFILCAISICICMTFSMPCAYALSRYKFKGINLFGIYIVIPLLMPSISYFLPLAVIIRRIELLTDIKIYDTYNAYLILGLMYAVMYMPFCIWILRGFIVSIPVEIEEAAKVDGCSNFGVLVRILVPLMKSGIIVGAVFLIMLVWDEKLLIETLVTKEHLKTISLFPSYSNFRYISGTISTIPIFIFYFFVQKSFIKGITGGGA